MLQEFDFEIKRIDGAKSQSDALSRETRSESNSISIVNFGARKQKTREKYENDRDYGKICEEIQKDEKGVDPKMKHELQRCMIMDGLLFEEPDRLRIPNGPKLRQEIMHDLRDARCAGRRGCDQTHDKMHGKHVWPNMASQLARCVKNCGERQKSKPRNANKIGLLHPLPMPKRSWEQISMDLIAKLPITPRGYDAALAVVGKLSKMTRFASTKANATASNTMDHADA